MCNEYPDCAMSGQTDFPKGTKVGFHEGSVRAVDRDVLPFPDLPERADLCVAIDLSSVTTHFF